MKKLFTLILCCTLASNLFAQTDTTEVKVMKRNVVTVTESADQVHVIVGKNEGIEVITDDWGDTTHIRVGRRTFNVIEGHNGTQVKVEKDHKRQKWGGRFNPHWAGLEAGVNVVGKSDYSMYEGTEYEQLGEFLDFNPGKSWSWNLNIMEFAFKNERKTFGLVTGLGFSFNDYVFNDPVTIEKEDGFGMIIPVDIRKENSSVKKTKLHVNYITVPLFFEVKTPLRMGASHLQIGAGVIGSLYLGSHTKYKYTDKEKQKSKGGYHINQWKYELTGRLGFGDLCLFANYSMTSLFKDTKGPMIQPIMFGISFPNF